MRTQMCQSLRGGGAWIHKQVSISESGIPIGEKGIDGGEKTIHLVLLEDLSDSCM